MNKILVGAVVIAALSYFFFFKSSAPYTLIVDGKEYSDRRIDRTNDSNSTIYNYLSKTVDNHDYISLLYPESGTGSIDSWLDLFANHFAGQGFEFNTDYGARYGTKNTVQVYMVPLYEENILAMYVVEDIAKPGIPLNSDAFELIERMEFH